MFCQHLIYINKMFNKIYKSYEDFKKETISKREHHNFAIS